MIGRHHEGLRPLVRGGAVRSSAPRAGSADPERDPVVLVGDVERSPVQLGHPLDVVERRQVGHHLPDEPALVAGPPSGGKPEADVPGGDVTPTRVVVEQHRALAQRVDRADHGLVPAVRRRAVIARKPVSAPGGVTPVSTYAPADPRPARAGSNIPATSGHLDQDRLARRRSPGSAARAAACRPG